MNFCIVAYKGLHDRSHYHDFIITHLQLYVMCLLSFGVAQQQCSTKVKATWNKSTFKNDKALISIKCTLFILMCSVHCNFDPLSSYHLLKNCIFTRKIQ